MYHRICVLAVILSLASIVTAQNTFKGRVFGVEAEGDTSSLPNAVLKQIPSGIITLTNADGFFSIVTKDREIKLTVSSIGKRTDTMVLNYPELPVKIVLQSSSNALAEVKVEYYEPGNFRMLERITNTEKISQSGLLKLACCNLSESFENNASIDAGFADAVSGARQIQMLGLSGKYSQITAENIPVVRGLANSFGLSYIPGTWMESIQISKGTASVINGYESVTGQINVEYKKPPMADPLLVNLYQNSDGRSETNVVARWNRDDKNGGMVMAHASKQWMEMDQNHDSFLDVPLSDLYNVFMRWNSQIDGTLETKTGIRYLDDHRKGGQYDDMSAGSTPYRSDIHSKNFQAFNKTGFVLGKPGSSLGIINDYTWDDQHALLGNNNYKGTEQTYHLNAIYYTYLGDTRHKLNAGASFMFDSYDETLNDSSFTRSEKVPGVFAEYTFIPNDKFLVMVGYRTDYHSEAGWLHTPRLHLKYKVLSHSTIRASVGKGYRMPNSIGDNLSVLASSRILVWEEAPRIEEAYNAGLNILQNFMVAGNPWSVSLDIYHTRFVNQYVADGATNARTVMFYNIGWKSYSTSFQAELKAQPAKRLELTLAYRFNDVKQSFVGMLQDKPFVVKHRGLITGSYATPYKKWQFDATVQLNGATQLPNTSANPVAYQRPEHSPGYAYVLAQITRRFKHIELYVGGENLTNYRQKNPIVAADDPLGTYFDASMIWGPVTGRMWYGGLRWTIK